MTDRPPVASPGHGVDRTVPPEYRAPQAEALTPEFIDRYAVVGPPEHCIARLRELEGLGLSRITVIGPTAGADREAARSAERLLATEVLPSFS